jgi:hypothetical protein
MVLINTLSANNSASLQDTTSITSTYSYYVIIFDNLVPMTSGAILTAQYYIEGSWAVDNNYNSENWGNDYGGNNATSEFDSCLHVWQNGRSGPSINTGLFGTMTLFNPLETNTNKSYTAQLYAPQAYNNKGCQIYGGGAYLGNQQPVTGISFSFNSGNINSGAIKIYGWA